MMPRFHDRALDDALEALALEAVQNPPDLNFFRRLRLADDELRQSAMLAWLLDSDAPHRRGQNLLNRILEEAGSACRASGPYSVSREYAGPSAQIDLVVSHPGAPAFLLFLENKVWASEGDRQTRREEHDLQELIRGRRGTKPVRIFLTRDGHVAESPAWHPLSYDRLGEIVRAEVRHMAREWQSLVQDWVDARPGESVKPPTANWLVADQACMLALGNFCTRVTDQLPGKQRFIIRSLRMKGSTKGLLDLRCAPAAKWPEEFAETYLSIGVEFLQPSNLIGDTPGGAPRLWAWHRYIGLEEHARLVQGFREVAGQYLSRFDFGFMPESPVPTRHRGYIATTPVPQYRLGMPRFSQKLGDRLFRYWDHWTNLLTHAGQRWPP